MIGLNNYSRLKKQTKLEQSYLYVSNSVLDILKDKKIKVIGITGSFIDQKGRSIICENICKNMCDRVDKVCLVTAHIDVNNKNYSLHETVDKNLKIISTQNISKSKLGELTDKEQADSIVVVEIPPVNIFAQALEYAKVCKNVFLIEKYCNSRYSDFENTLEMLSQNNISVLGIVTHV